MLMGTTYNFSRTYKSILYIVLCNYRTVTVARYNSKEYLKELSLFVNRNRLFRCNVLAIFQPGNANKSSSLRDLFLDGLFNWNLYIHVFFNGCEITN